MAGSTEQVSTAEENLAGLWFARFISAFLLGGAIGGWAFGWLADRAGRVQALGWSVLCYSLLTAANAWVRTPEELCLLRFLASFGIGGTWSAAVPLLAEAWPAGSRPTVAGLLGAAGNAGILLIALIGRQWAINPANWRDVALVGGAPFVVGLIILFVVPESRAWKRERGTITQGRGLLREALTPPILQRTLLGIVLGTVPLLGTWSSGKWLIPWADRVLANSASTQAIWAAGATLGSLIGGWIADRFGRRSTYFTICLATLIINVTIYRTLAPTRPLFLPAVFLLGLVGTIFFGWLPLYLPELFPTRVRATGAGITYNSGRVLSAAGVLTAGSMMEYFGGDYARVGESMAWIYLVGMVAILFAPDTSNRLPTKELR
jgi:MFS family permease